MSIYAVTHSLVPTTQAKKVVDAATTTDTSTVSESTLATDAPVTTETPTTVSNTSVNTQTSASVNTQPPSIDSTGSLTKNVLQTMQNMGFNTASLSADDSQVLQNFVQSLYKALTPVDVMAPQINSTSVDTASIALNADNSVDVVQTDTHSLISGGNGFKYTI
ncbi:MAG: hypothetical protein RLZZ384_1047, partial [Pseudomonadota bacterium]